MEGQRSLNVHNVERNIMDNVGHGATHPTKSHRKEDGKETEKETAREPRKVESSKEEKTERLNEITEPPEEQWTGGSWEQWSEQSWNAEADTASWRDDDWYTADSNSQSSAAAEEFQHASVGDLRFSNLGFVEHIESLQHERLDPSRRTITFGIDTAACKTVCSVCCSCQSPCSTLVFGPQRLLTWMCIQHWQAEIKCMIKEKRILCTSAETGKPMAIESRKVDCRQPLTAVTEMTDCGRWVCFGPQRQGFSFDPRTGQKIEFTPTPGG